MCGIVGQINRAEPVDQQLFQRMRDTLAHRGPDGYHSQFLNDHRVALGHRRLSIIDLSESGRQPMSNEDGSLWLTFNGEIYNFRLLREQLVARGHCFQSQTDSEVLLHGYEEWGIEGLLARLKGMFAFAIWDQNLQRLVAARDRFGIKPFYFHLSPHRFLFGSELKAILEHSDTPRKLDYSAVLDYFVHRFIPSPKTIWEGLQKLAPATHLEFELSTWNTKLTRYWKATPGFEQMSESETVERMDELLTRAMSDHLESDVPIGVFLSGGYDSNGLLLYLQKLGYSPSTFSMGFPSWGESEHVQAKASAEHFQTDHHELLLEPSFLEICETLSFYYDEPLGDTSMIPTYLISQFASQRVKVCMGGDGGDELFAGYNWYYEIMAYIESRGRLRKTKDFLRYRGSAAKALRMYFEKMNWTGLSYQQANRLLNSPLGSDTLPEDLWLQKKTELPQEDVLKSLQTLDLEYFLPESILTKVDRASMANSLEVRVPYLDHELTEFLFGLNSSVYFESGKKKKILERLLVGRMPEGFFERKKSGFSMPLESYESFDQMFEVVKKGELLKNGLIWPEGLNHVREGRIYSVCTALFLFELWFQKWAA